MSRMLGRYRSGGCACPDCRMGDGDTRWRKRMEARELSAGLVAEIREGIEQAERGETADLGGFAQYADDDEPASECDGGDRCSA
jgi:hypothetical protein